MLEVMVRRREALRSAREAWAKAPAHVRVMASAYVEPLLNALDAIGAELDYMHDMDAAPMPAALPVRDEGVRP